MSVAVTKPEVAAAINAVKAIADAIRELGSVPSGEFYARVSGYLTIGQYEKVIGLLKGAGLVRETNHVLTWVEPK